MAVGDYPIWSHEKVQIDQLVFELQAVFGKSPDRTELIVNVRVDGEQVDALIYRNGGLIAVEAKSWEGRIAAGFKGEYWSVRTETEERSVPSPREQVARKRRATGRLITSLGEASRGVEVATENIQGWVVVNANSKPTLTGVPDSDRWFDVVPVSDVVRILREEPLPSVLSHAAFDSLIAKVGAKRCGWKDWLQRSSVAPGADLETSGVPADYRIPKIDSWLHNTDPSLVIKALDLVRELELPGYGADILGAVSHPNPSVQWKALQLAIDWWLPGFRERIAEFVEHTDDRVRRAILELLARESFPEAVAALARVAHNGTGEDVRLAIQGLGLAGGDGAERALLRLINRRVQGGPDPGDFPLETLVRAIGKAKVQAAVPTLLAMLDWPEVRGSPRGDRQHESFRETLFIALGMLGGKAPQETIAAELRNNRTNPVVGLEAAAELATPALAELVLPYLDAEDEGIQQLAVVALRKARNPIAFEPLYRRWRDRLGDRGDSLDRELDETLIAIDPRRLERELLALLKEHKGFEQLHRIWWIWDRVLSPESRDTFLRMLEGEDSSLNASAFLTRIADEHVLDRARLLIRKGSGKVRAGALSLLAFRMDTQDAARLADEFARDESPDVRQAVLGAYSRLPEPEGRSKVLPFAADASQDVRDYAFAILARHALALEVRATWASSDGRSGTGRVLLIQGALVLEADGPAAILPYPGISRVGSCHTLGPGGMLYVLHQPDGETASFAISLEKDPFDRRLNPAVDFWYEAVVGAVKAVRGRRADLGPRGLTPNEGPRARELVAKARV